MEVNHLLEQRSTFDNWVMEKGGGLRVENKGTGASGITTEKKENKDDANSSEITKISRVKKTFLTQCVRDEGRSTTKMSRPVTVNYWALKPIISLK